MFKNLKQFEHGVFTVAKENLNFKLMKIMLERMVLNVTEDLKHREKGEILLGCLPHKPTLILSKKKNKSYFPLIGSIYYEMS